MPITQILLTANSGGGSPNAYAGYGTTPVEGSTTTITITVENWPGDRVYWTVVGKGDLPTNPSTDMTGTLSGFWDPGATSFAQTVVTTIGFVADDGTEGTEYWGVDLGSTEGGADYYSSNAWPIEEPPPPPADFTIEWWQKVDNGGGSSPRPWSVGLYPTQQVALSYEGKISDYFWINNSYINATSQDHRSQGWRHMAYVRDSGVLKGYINGTQYTPNITSTQQITGTTIPLYVGTGEVPFGNFNGYITNLHIMKGYAKYTGNFTAPTEPTVPTVSSVFLIPAQNNVTPYFDITNTPHGVTAAVGSPTWSSDTPFTAPTAAGPYTRYNNSWGGVNLQKAGELDFGSGNDDLLNIKRGWIVTDGTNTGYVINDAYQPGGADAVRIEITFTPTAAATYTFTQYQVGGSLYFNGSSYLNYGASADWAFDFLPPTYTLTPATTSTNEGSAITFNVTGTNIVNGTYYWTIQTNSSDFATTSSSFTITNNTGSFTVTPSADVTTEGAETFTVAIRSDSNTGTILSTSTSVTINDTSLAPVPPFSMEFNHPQQDFLRVPASSDFNLGTTWTIEFWLKANSSGYSGNPRMAGDIWGLLNQGGWTSANQITVAISDAKLCIGGKDNGEDVRFAEPSVGGVPDIITAITDSSGSWESNYGTNIATTGGTGIGLTVDVSAAGSGYAGTVAINTPGSGYTTGDVITAVNGSVNGGSSVTFTITASALGVWTHVAVVNNTGTQLVYYNGVQQSSVSGTFDSGNYTSSSEDIYIGRLAPNYGGYFDGKMAMVRISNTAKYLGTFNPITTYGVEADTVLFLDSDTPLVDTSTSTHTIVNNGVTVSTDFPAPPTYTIALESLGEGNFWAFSFVGTNLPVGTYYYTTTAGDDIQNPSGQLGTVTETTATTIFSREGLIVADGITEGPETFTVSVRFGSTTGTILVTSNSETIIDSSNTLTSTYVITPEANNVNEGSALTINVTTTNVPGLTQLYWTVSEGNNFVESSGDVTISNQVGYPNGTFEVTPTADATTEGSETFTVSLRTGSISGTVVATSDPITINDTSTTPP